MLSLPSMVSRDASRVKGTVQNIIIINVLSLSLRARAAKRTKGEGSRSKVPSSTPTLPGVAGQFARATTQARTAGAPVTANCGAASPLPTQLSGRPRLPQVAGPKPGTDPAA